MLFDVHVFISNLSSLEVRERIYKFGCPQSTSNDAVVSSNAALIGLVHELFKLFKQQ